MDRDIDIIPKNTVEELRVSLSEFKGHDLVNLRIWTELEGKDEKVPTKKGITVNIRLLPDLIRALRKAEQAAKDAGLLEAA